jgi:DNA-binding HxlR family transcriptional regulator
MLDADTPPELATARTLLAADTFERDCASRTVMDQVTTRWATLIIASLIHGPHRFSALAARIGGISQKMLSQNLKTLVRTGLVHRQVEATVPPQVTYSLTPLGVSLATPLTQLIHWFGDNAAHLIAAQAQHDGEQAQVVTGN